VRKEPTRTSFEVDVVLGRHCLKYTDRAGVCKKAKRQMNKRARREWRGRMEKVVDVLDDGLNG